MVVSNVAGNSFLNAGEKSDSWPLIILGVLILISWMLARMTLLSWADLSWVLPVTAIGYVLSAAAGQMFFAEQITGWRWVGTGLIAIGVALVANTEKAPA